MLVHKAPGYLSAAPRDRSVRGLALDPVAAHVPVGRGAHLNAARGLLVRVAHLQVDHAQPGQAGLPAHLHPAPVAHLGVRFVRPTHARPFSRPKERGGSDTIK